MRTKILLRNTSLNIGLTIVVLLKLMLWPLKVTNKGLTNVGKWLLRQYR